VEYKGKIEKGMAGHTRTVQLGGIIRFSKEKELRNISYKAGLKDEGKKASKITCGGWKQEWSRAYREEGRKSAQRCKGGTLERTQVRTAD